MLFFSSALYISCLALAAEQTVIYIKILRTGSQVKASLITIKNCPPIANILKCLLFKLPLQPIKVKSSQRMSKRAELNCKHTSIAYDSLCYRGMFSLQKTKAGVMEPWVKSEIMILHLCQCGSSVKSHLQSLLAGLYKVYCIFPLPLPFPLLWVNRY